ncbi:MAG TPA: hypothetical protein VFV22_00015 [Candidatus Paceibacterota bacterium]|nr:hypothetical protein [Candidatus Paceibacterota bacterium]
MVDLKSYTIETYESETLVVNARSKKARIRSVAEMVSMYITTRAPFGRARGDY